jgi:hypothetical protein
LSHAELTAIQKFLYLKDFNDEKHLELEVDLLEFSDTHFRNTVIHGTPGCVGSILKSSCDANTIVQL